MGIEGLIEHIDFTNELIKQKINEDGFIQIYYYKTICDKEKIEHSLIKPLYSLQDQENYIQTVCMNKQVSTIHDLHSQLIKGNVLVLVHNGYYFFDANKSLINKPGTAKTETTIQGPQSSLSEDLKANLNLIRHRYPSETFQIESYEVGTVSKTVAYLLFDTKLVNTQVLCDVKKKLENISEAMIQSTGQLGNILNEKKRSLFPVFLLTERPDRIALNLSQGKIIIIIDGTPFALILPVVFFDFISAMDDLYLPFWVTFGLKLLRYIGISLSITLPAIYISVISFNPEFFRVQLTYSIAGSRAAVPYPSYWEVLFMLFMTEILTEASIRLPKFIGGTATTVGGLILGQAAQQAGLVSSIMIIITSAVTISNFVFPINTMIFSIRVIRYPLIFLSCLFGLVGLVVGLFCFTCYLANLRSFGQPYFKIFINESLKSYNTH